MNFYVMTLFPEMVRDGLHTSILGRAADAGIIGIEAVNIRDYTLDKHRHVDDYPYGGGAGMLMMVQPIADAIKYVQATSGLSLPVYYMSPKGTCLTQKKVREMASIGELVPDFSW